MSRNDCLNKEYTERRCMCSGSRFAVRLQDEAQRKEVM